MYEAFIKFVELVETFGYLGIFIMTFIESTFIPIPSEVTLIPAGYLIAKGGLNIWLTVFWSAAGTISGSLFNYYIAKYFGRNLLMRYGRYFFIDSAKMEKIESFFDRHGAISTFSGRLLPGVKHFISFPAGLAKMDIKYFIFYTGLGGTIWILVLICLGYFIGTNEGLITKYLKQVNFILFVLIVCLVAFYSWRKSLQKKL